MLAAAWMCVIFWFSAQDADLSELQSHRVGYAVGRMAVPGFNDLPEESRRAFAEKVDMPVRKAAHATEYALLGMLLTGALWQEPRRDAPDAAPEVQMRQASGNKTPEPAPVGEPALRYAPSGLYALAISAAYAATDEFHQLFVLGRACRFSDVLIDSAGAGVGIFAVLFIIRIIVIRSREGYYGSKKSRSTY